MRALDIFVTGGNGFLGTALCARLKTDGHRVVHPGSRQCDLTKADSLARFDDQCYDMIYHLAAWTQAGDFCLRHPGEQWVLNQQLNTNVLAWWQRSQPQAKLIAMGTSCAYAPDRELSEENYLEGQPIDSLFTYAMTKRMLYVGMRSLSKQFGLRYLCLVPSTLYGPGYHTDGRQMHFIFDLIRKILTAQAGGPPAILWGDGHQKRELVYIDDFVDALLRLATDTDNALVNIGAGTEHSIREFAHSICDLTGYDFDKIRFDTSRYVGAKSKVLSVAKLRELLPDYRPRPLRDGLAETIAWFRANWDAIVDAHAASAA
jgi:GDP-L-fucose synthase